MTLYAPKYVSIKQIKNLQKKPEIYKRIYSTALNSVYSLYH
jgi:hypothetical protein